MSILAKLCFLVLFTGIVLGNKSPEDFVEGKICSNKYILAVLPSAPEARARGASLAIEISKPMKPRKIGYARAHGLGLGTSLPLSLIWSPSYAKGQEKHFRFVYS